MSLFTPARPRRRLLRLFLAFLAVMVLVALFVVLTGVQAASAAVLAATDGAAAPPTFEIPVIPAALIVLLNVISPYFVDLLNAIDAPPAKKKTIALVLSGVVTVALIIVSLLVGWIPSDWTPLGWVTLIVLGAGVQQFVFSVFWKDSAASKAVRAQGVQ